ncbi:hypothetical protein M459_0206865 [Staphylococcus epidermidis Scl25]|nr:hypothetical protein M460_0205275 [Staphylococcus epidermidis Scl31]EST98863.1 hypothetical protein M459_0206865 [Staphylococcus epidermidis Scl25]
MIFQMKGSTTLIISHAFMPRKFIDVQRLNVNKAIGIKH